MSYILPQVQVFQEFSVLPTAVVKNLNAFVFGANYQLFRYAEAAEKALVGLGAYDKDADTEYVWPNQPVDSVVDLEYTKLYMEDVWAEYLQIPSGASAPLVMVSAAQRNKLRAAPIIAAAVNVTSTPSATIASGGYFTGHVGLPEDYYFYPVGGATGEVTAVTAEADVADSLDGLSFLVDTPSKKYQPYFSTSGGGPAAAPATPSAGYTPVQVSITTADAATVVAVALAAALDALPEVSCPVPTTAVVSVVCAGGDATDVTDVDTAWTIVQSIDGADAWLSTGFSAVVGWWAKRSA